MFPHEKLLSDSSVTKKDLPTELLNKIKEFDMKKNRRENDENQLKSVGIAQLLWAWMDEAGLIVDEKDGDDTPAPVTTVVEPVTTVVEPVTTVVEPVTTVVEPVTTVVEPVTAVVEPVAPVEPPVKKKKFIPLLGWVEVK
jgi:hypothetical protein